MDYTSYYEFLIVMWCIVWALGFWYFHSRRTRGPLLRRLTPTRRILLVVATIALPCLYVLSYAPLMRSGLGTFDDLFVPVQWLIDNTPLREPLISWASLWNVPAETLEVPSSSRMHGSFWGTVPAPFYAAGWIAIGIICCVTPPLILEPVVHAVRTRIRSSSEPLAT